MAVQSAPASYFPVPFHLQQQQQSYLPASAVGSVYPSAYTYPQYLKVQQLFHKDAQTITPEALATVKAAIASSAAEQKVETKRRAIPLRAAGQSWEDPTLADWPEKVRHDDHAKEVLRTALRVTRYKDDFRVFCGDLGNEVNDDVLTKAFSRFPSFNMARFVPITVAPMPTKVVRDKKTGKTKGYGFVSFANANDLAEAIKEMNGKYVGNRPIKLRKSTWKRRIDYEALEKQQKEQVQKKKKLTKRSVLHK